jgi:hypothetical protein
MTECPLFSWQADRDQALALVEANAGREFSDRAQRFVVGFLAVHGAAAGEKITDAAKAAGIVPHDDRAFGAVYLRLARAGIIRKAGSVKREKGHGTGGGNVWEVVV